MYVSNKVLDKLTSDSIIVEDFVSFRQKVEEEIGTTATVPKTILW